MSLRVKSDLVVYPYFRHYRPSLPPTPRHHPRSLERESKKIRLYPSAPGPGPSGLGERVRGGGRRSPHL